MHSIESKTHYALFVYDVQNPRKDMLGISPASDDPEAAISYQENANCRLKEIRLYSKAALKNNPDVAPIKTVHFNHDYSLCKGIPNGKELNSGKLTLKSVYFTYGANGKGRLSPYVFTYNSPSTTYGYQMQDRWGNYKNHADNPDALSNTDYPYALQDKEQADENIAIWKLEKIELPSGGSIEITYESDDYSYVQNRRAMKMTPLAGVNSFGTSSGLINAHAFVVRTVENVTPESFRDAYLEKQDYLLYKFFVDLDNKGHKEFVQGYAKIRKNEISVTDGKTVVIPVEKIEGYNPVAHTAWQMLRTSLPEYAYRNYLQPNGGPKGMIKALVSIAPTIKDELTGFKNRAEKSNFANNVDLGKSFVRLCDPTYRKLGGGHRVKQVSVKDEWGGFSGLGPSYSQTLVYDYSMDVQTDAGEMKADVSSGVASYEPLLGNEENPFRQPIMYTERVPFTMINTYTLEEPMGESYFPSPEIVYQQVKVSTLGADSQNSTGYTLNEFYTAKEFPTIVGQTKLTRHDRRPNMIMQLLNITIRRYVGVSQGYSVELNDMHGRPKSQQVFDAGGAKTSAVYYFYKSESIGQKEFKLRNEIDMLKSDGTVTTGQMGVDIDLFHDMRYEETKNDSYEGDANTHTLFMVFPAWFALWLTLPSFERNEFFGSSSIKVINRTGIIDRVVKMENGSQIETANLLWDEETGEPILTRTQNEFDDHIYNFTYPAHWAYQRMGGAYKNSGLIINQFSTTSSGTITTAVGLLPGDELINLGDRKLMWVVKPTGANDLKLIDRDGEVVFLQNSKVKVVRSGNRNLANASIGSIVSMQNPIAGSGVNRHLDVGAYTKILSASATTYADEWTIPAESKQVVVPCTECPTGYTKMNVLFPGSGADTICMKDLSWASSSFDVQNQTDSICKQPPGSYLDGDHKIYSQYTKLDQYATTLANHQFWKNRVNNRIIWNCGGASAKFKITTLTFLVPATKTYYVGLWADGWVRLIFNNTDWRSLEDVPSNDTWTRYRIFPIVLNGGLNTVSIYGEPDGFGTSGLAFEVYDNTWSQLVNADSPDDVNPLLSSGAFGRTNTNKMGDYGCGGSGFSYTQYYFDYVHGTNYETMSCIPYDLINLGDLTCYSCEPSDNKIFNPYISGLKGNWRPEGQWVYKENRNQPLVNENDIINGTDIRNSGAYLTFSPFWNGSFQPNPVKWIKSNEITTYNRNGQELENKNALGQYSSAQFGFNNTLPVAVAANSRQRQVAYEGFEDFGFTGMLCKTPDPCAFGSGPFSFKAAVSQNPYTLSINNQKSHTGKYSLEVSGTVSVSDQRGSDTGPMMDFDVNGRAVLRSAGINRGFSPSLNHGEKYVFSAWIRDESANNAGNKPSTAFEFRAYTSPQISYNLTASLPKWGPLIDGWRQVEIVFTQSLPGLTDAMVKNFEVRCNPGSSTIYLDDIRVYPVDGQMKSFAYDDANLRLMAELDENNYATFFEYDDEGSLIRVKKETERGVQTIKENRNHQRKNPLIN